VGAGRYNAIQSSRGANKKRRKEKEKNIYMYEKRKNIYVCDTKIK
jgi:hypothetical protein